MQLPDKWVAVDTETTGLNPWRGARIVCLAIVWPNGDSRYFRGYQMEQAREILADPTIDKVFHNAKFDMHMLHHSGFVLRGQIWDTMILGHLLDGRDAGSNLSLAFQSSKYLRGEHAKIVKPIEEFFAQAGIEKDEWDFSKLPEELLKARCVGDTQLTAKLFERLYPTVSTLFHHLLIQEHKLLHVVRRMEERGVPIDVSEIDQQYEMFDQIHEYVVDWFEGMTGRHYFKVTERGALLELTKRIGLHETLTNEEGKVKLDEHHLRQSGHPVAHMILLGRAALKMRDTFLVQMDRLQVNGILHPNFNQLGTCSGRFSCSGPNLQNIPTEGNRRASFTEEEAAEAEEMTGVRYAPHIKRIFTIPKGHARIHCDKSQAEMCMLAHYANDPVMIRIFESGENIHEGICRALYNEVTKGLKTRTKAVVFGFIYGAGLQTIARKIGSDVAEARTTRDRLAGRLTGLPRLKSMLTAQVNERGYIETVHGRRHYLSRRDGYKAVNRLCQGSVGDEIKDRMIAIDDYLQSEIPEAGIVLNIHDDIASDIPDEHLHKALPDIFQIMQESTTEYRLKLPSAADITYTTWSDLKELDIEDIERIKHDRSYRPKHPGMRSDGGDCSRSEDAPNLNVAHQG